MPTGIYKYYRYKYHVYYKTTVYICPCYRGSSKFLYIVKMSLYLFLNVLAFLYWVVMEYKSSEL